MRRAGGPSTALFASFALISASAGPIQPAAQGAAPIHPVAQSAAPIHPAAQSAAGGRWYVLGPFDYPPGAPEISTPLAPESELRRYAAGEPGPDLSLPYPAKGGEQARWTELAVDPASAGASGAVVKVDLERALARAGRADKWHERAIAYVYGRIEAESDGELQLGAGSDDALRLWFDGQVVVDAQRIRRLCPADHRLRLALRRGANHLLAKVANNAGPWSFQTIEWREFDQQAVDSAIDRGLRCVLDRQLLDGTWGFREDFGTGHPAFAAYALLKCGLGADHPAVRMALRRVEVDPPVTTYGIASAVLALAATGQESHRAEIEAYVDTLRGWGGRDGLYGYPEHPDGYPRADDLSCTTFAALAFRAAEQVGLRQPDAIWRELVEGALSCFHGQPRRGTQVEPQPAGFSYQQASTVTASMTAAGVAVLALAEAARGDKFPAKTRREIDEAEAAGVAWLARNLDWGWNRGNDGGQFQYYTAYGIERVGALLGLEKLGAADWYREGAEFMVLAQADDGSWTGNGGEAEPRIDTLLALLFLKRATASATGIKGPGERYDSADPAAEIQLHATGDTPLVLWMGEIRGELAAELVAPEDGTLDVARASFQARPERSKTGLALAEVRGRRLLPGDLPQLAGRAELPRNGRWVVWGELELGPGGPGAGRVLKTPELTVSIDLILAPERLEYAAESRRNLVPRVGARVEASSAAGDGAAAGAADGRMSTWWACARTDARPWLTLTFERAQKADRIALVHAWPRLEQDGQARAAEIEIVLDGRERHRLTMRPDRLLKTTLDLPRPTSIRELRVEIVSAADGELGRDSVGLAEVELLRREKGD